MGKKESAKVPPVVINNVQPNNNQQAAQPKQTCFDSDGNSTVAKGFVRSSNQNGTETTVYDECVGNNGQISEKYCYEMPAGSGNFVAGAMISTCDNGCIDGACNQGQNSTNFDYPYPVTWMEDGIEFSLTEAAIGDMYDATNPTKGVFYGIALYLKVKTFNDSASWAELNLREEINEQGDLVLPVTKQFVFQPSGGAGVSKNAVYNDQKVIFEEKTLKKVYSFTTGGTSNIYFQIKVGDYNHLEVIR
jgi:hypothetical protein